MSYAAPFSLLSFHLPPGDDSAEERLTWPLAGSLVIHVVVFMAFLSLRFASSLEQSSGSYEVTLVTLPEIASSPTASPANKSRPQRSADKVLPPKAKVRKAVSPPRQAVRTTSPRPQARVPNRAVDSLMSEPKLRVPAIPPKVVTPPPPVSANPKPILKQNAVKLPPPPQADDGEVPKPELVTDSLMGALESVVVPKPQALDLPQKAVPVPAPSPPPVKQAPAVELDVQPTQAPPKPPKLVVGKSEAPTPTPRAELLAQKLKQRVDTIVVPKKPEQGSSHVSPTVRSDIEQKQDTTRIPESPRITLPRRAPRLAAVAPPEAPEKETPRQTARERSTVESLTQALQSVRVPEKISMSETPPPVPEAVPLVPETSPKHPRAADLPQNKFVPPQAPQLAKVPVEQAPVSSQSTVPMTTSVPDTLGSQIAKFVVPDVPAFDSQPGFQQTESGAQETLELRVAGSSPRENAYWGRVRAMIAGRWIVYRVEFKSSQPLQVVLAFRVERNGQVTKPTVARSSGNTYFDSTAKRAVVAATPLPSFPDNMSKPFYDVQYTFTGPRN